MPTPRRPELHAAPYALSLTRLAGRIVLAVLVCAEWLGQPNATAQSPVDGAVAGRALTLRGQPLPRARVLLHNLDGLPDRLTRSAADGTFFYAHVPPGTYVVSFTAAGIDAAASPPFIVALGQTAQILAGERLSGGAVTVEVTADNSQPAEDGLASAISREELAALPQPQRRWQDAALLAPGINPDQDGDGLLSAHGLPSDQNTILVDGQETTQAFASVPAGTGSDLTQNPDQDADSAEQGTAQGSGQARGRRAGASFTFTQSAVREFRVSNLTYSAQTSHAAGAVVETITREGTSTFHGGASALLRSQIFAAYDPLAVATSYADGLVSTSAVKPHDLRENASAWLGGPLGRARSGVTFFYAVDLQRRGFPAISTPANPLFYQLTNTQAALLATRGVAPAQTNAALDYLSSLTGSAPRRADESIHFARLDWHPGTPPANTHADTPTAPSPRRLARIFKHPGLSLGLEYNHAQWSFPAGLTQAPTVAAARASLGNSAGSLDSALLRVTDVFTPRTVNQLRLGFLRDLQFETAQPNLPQEPQIGPGGQAPEVNIAPNGLLFGTPANLSRAAYPKEQRLSLDEVFTLIRGPHLIEFGGSAALIQDHVATQPNPAGTFLYDSSAVKGSAGGLVDFITDFTFNVNQIPNGGCPSITAASHLFCFRSFSQSFGQSSASYRTAEYAAFVEDTWRLRPGLTLHAGARYEYTLLPLPQQPNAAIDALFGSLASNGGATSVFPEDRNNLGPRLALSWAPARSAWTARAGFGLFYGRLPGATILAALADTALPGSVSRLRLTPATVTACPQAPANGFGYPCAFLAEPGSGLSSVTSAAVFDRRFRLPVVEQGSFSLERRLGRAGSISAGYLFDLDRQLPTSTDLNIAPATTTRLYQLQDGTGAPGVRDGETFQLPFYTSRLTPSFGPVTAIRSSANATYHALILSAALDPVPTLRLRANYTWAKALDDDPSLSATPRTNNQLDPYINGYDKGLSALNYPQTLHVTAIYEPVPRTPPGLRRRLLSGWLLAPVVVAHSGRPYSFNLSGGPALPGGHESLNASGGALYLPSVGRNTLRLPPVVNADLRVARQLRLGDLESHLRLHLSAEAFNLLNHRNVSAVSERAYLVGTPAAGVTPLVFQNAAAIAAEGLNTQPFATPTTASTALTRERQLQFGLRLEF